MQVLSQEPRDDMRESNRLRYRLGAILKASDFETQQRNYRAGPVVLALG